MTCEEVMALRGAGEVRPVSDTEILAALKHVGQCPVCEHALNESWSNVLTEEQRKRAERESAAALPRLISTIQNDPEV